jgi:long-chain acyl-CoA synthetase
VPRETLIDFFRDLVAIPGEFLVYDDGYRRRAHRYDEVGRAARAFAARLTAAGVRKGEHVVFWGENRPEWIAAYWGCLLNGIVVVPIDYRSPAEFVDKVSALVDAKVMLVGDEVKWGGGGCVYGTE